MHDQLWIYVRQKGVFGSGKLWFSYINFKNQIKIKILARFRPIFDFELKGKGHEPSLVELKILQLWLWLEPARLGLITTAYTINSVCHSIRSMSRVLGIHNFGCVAKLANNLNSQTQNCASTKVDKNKIYLENVLILLHHSIVLPTILVAMKTHLLKDYFEQQPSTMLSIFVDT